MHREEFSLESQWLIAIHGLPSRRVQRGFPTMHSRESLLYELRTSATMFDSKSTSFHNIFGFGVFFRARIKMFTLCEKNK